MAVEPSSVIKLYSGIPLDNTYQHTLYFDSVEAQTAFFATRAKYTLQPNTYQRVNRGKMRIAKSADDCYNCNYLAFQNTRYGTKWFYAFIISVEYVNDNTCEITYELDVMQTWWKEAILKSCYVEREHSKTDEIGDNLVPENLELGEYVSDTFDQFLDDETDMNIVAPTSIVVAATFDSEYEKISGGYYGNVFSGVYYTVFENSSTGAEECANWLKDIPDNKKDGVVAVFIAPTNFITGITENVKSYNSSIDKLYDYTGEEYTIKNNKLYTYPFNFLYVSNLQGISAIYPYEYFDSEKCEFTITGDFSCDPTVMCIPNNYKGVVANYDERLSLSGYPQCSWNTDVFGPWLAQNIGNIASGSLATSYADSQRAWNMASPPVMTQSLGQVAGAGSPFALAMAGVHVANSIGQMVYHAGMPPQAHGVNGKSAMIATSIQTFAIMKKHIRLEFAKIIDEYFSVYGYATHRVKIPNRNVRERWTYTKTIGCTIKGSMPSEDIKKLCLIYDNGITFWKDADEVGDYTGNNAPI